jgi:hypothetical protein
MKGKHLNCKWSHLVTNFSEAWDEEILIVGGFWNTLQMSANNIINTFPDYFNKM